LRLLARSGRDARRIKRYKGKVAWVLRQMSGNQALIDYFEGKFDRDEGRPKGWVKDDSETRFLKQLLTPFLEKNKGKPHYRIKSADEAFEFLQTGQGRRTVFEKFMSDRTFSKNKIRKAAGCRGK
jgi:hypothetical protein